MFVKGLQLIEMFPETVRLMVVEDGVVLEHQGQSNVS